MKCFVIENRSMQPLFIQHGWGNGYVCIPKDHPLYGIDYWPIHDLMPDLEVNGGLTFACASESITASEIPEECKKDHWIVGFDTAHSWDDMDRWPDAESVMREAERLAEQLEAYKPVAL